MKIALVRTASNILTYGGYNIQEIGLARALTVYGVSSDIYARFSNVQEDTVIVENNDCQVRLRPLKGKQIYREIMYYPSLKSDLIKGDYDIVQLLDDSQMMLPFLFKALKERGSKTILWQGMYRNFPAKPARMMQIVYDLLFAGCINKYSDLKIAKTEAAKKYLEFKKYHNIITIPVGLDEVESVVNTELDKRIAGFKEKYPHTLLYIGAIEQRRNPDFLVDVLELLNRDDIGLVVIGKGILKEHLLGRIAVSKRKRQILYFEKIPNNELISVFSRADLLLLPTNYEIYGMVVMEALSYGVPVISTPEAGPAYILSERILGICLKLNTEVWCDEISRRLATGVSNADKQYMHNYVDEKFRWPQIAAEYYNVLSKLMMVSK